MAIRRFFSFYGKHLLSYLTYGYHTGNRSDDEIVIYMYAGNTYTFIAKYVTGAEYISGIIKACHLLV